MLRGTLDWSLVHSRVLAARFAEAADRRLESGGPAEMLRGCLHAVWTAVRELRRIEQERRQSTVALLAGGWRA